MSIFRKAGTTAALSVAGVGIAVGGVGLAGAADTSDTSHTSRQTASVAASAAEQVRAQGHRGHGGPGNAGRGGPGGAGADLLAEALDLDESDVEAALASVRDELSTAGAEDGERTRPTEAERAERSEQWAAALADELGVTEQELATAMESLRDARAEVVRTALAERLDDAVADGDLTASDRESVLKAFDAGVLGGDRRGR